MLVNTLYLRTFIFKIFIIGGNYEKNSKKALALILTLVTVFITCLAFGCAPKQKEPSISNNFDFLNELTLPVISLDFDGNPPLQKADDYRDCTVSTLNCNSEYLLTDVDAEVKIRGNSTAEGAKKPYRIKFKSKQGMLGLNDGAKCKSWVLLADYFDYSSMRNYFIYSLGKTFNNVYAPDVQHVNLYIDGYYKGVYLLTEQTQINKYRINIDEDNVETSVDTGYLVEADSRALSECVLFDPNDKYASTHQSELEFGVCTKAEDIVAKTDYCFAVTYKYRRTSGVSDLQYQLFAVKNDLSSDKQIAFDQLTFIANYMQTCYDLIFDPDRIYNEGNFSAYIDIESCVDMFLINNMASLRGGKRSEYYYIDKSATGDGLLHFGPPWDYDLDCGNYDLGDNQIISTEITHNHS